MSHRYSLPAGLFISLLLFSGCAGHSGNIETVWSANADFRKPLSAYASSQPAAAGDLIVIGGADAWVHVYDSSGSELRRVAIQTGCESGALALSSGLVVLGDIDGILYGIDPVRGVIVWQQQLSSFLMGVPVETPQGVLVQTADNHIYHFDASGKKLWSYTGSSSGLMFHASPSPLVSGEQVYAVLSNGDVVAIRLKSGDLLWSRQLLLDNRAVVLGDLRVPLASPLLIANPRIDGRRMGDALMVSLYQGEWLLISRSDGSRLHSWKISLKSTPLLSKGVIYAAGKGFVMARDSNSSTTLWKQDVGEGEWVGPVLYQNHLWAASDQGEVIKLDMNGKILDRIAFPGRIDHAPVVAPSGLLVRNHLGNLYLVR